VKDGKEGKVERNKKERKKERKKENYILKKYEINIQ
jgi:hypothetical protein